MISVENVVKRYDKKEAVNGISFEINKGEICGYIGPNGAGKTTTVKILGGILPFNEGRVLVAGVDVGAEPDRVKPLYGYVPENGAVFESLTAGEYLLFAGRLLGLPDPVIRERSTLLFDYFDLTSARDQTMSSYSKGMKQKVLISAALVHQPDIYFFDEPLNGLDANATLLFKELLRHLAMRGKTILYCSHLLDIVEKVCHRIVVLKEGAIVAQGDIEHLRELTGTLTLDEVFTSLTSTEDSEEKTVRFLDALASA